MSYRARVGDVIEWDGYVGIITYADGTTTKLDWISNVHPDADYRLSHPDADWYPVPEWEAKLNLICNVHDQK